MTQNERLESQQEKPKTHQGPWATICLPLWLIVGKVMYILSAQISEKDQINNYYYFKTTYYLYFPIN